jgi:hypothetical protein
VDREAKEAGRMIQMVNDGIAKKRQAEVRLSFLSSQMVLTTAVRLL